METTFFALRVVNEDHGVAADAIGGRVDDPEHGLAGDGGVERVAACQNAFSGARRFGLHRRGGRKNSRSGTTPTFPAEEVDWLTADLKATDKKVVVFAHQRLDVANDYGVKNAAEVRKVLEGSGKVLAVFQGHSHKNDYKEIGGIHYCTWWP